MVSIVWLCVRSSEFYFVNDFNDFQGAQIEKYIKHRMEKIPEKEDMDSDWVKDTVHWQLYCYEMLFLWNTFPSCDSEDLLTIIQGTHPMLYLLYV